MCHLLFQNGKKCIHISLYLHKEILKNTQKVMEVVISGGGVRFGWMKEEMEVGLFTVLLFCGCFEPQV